MSYETEIKFTDINEGDIIRHEIREMETSKIVSVQRVAEVFSQNTNEWFTHSGLRVAAEWHDDPKNGHRLFRVKQ